MSLNIKNTETHRLARELAQLTGESLTAAISQALRERLDRLKKHRSGKLSEKLLDIGEACAPRLKGRHRTKDHGEILYDEKGLPK
jgi:antitoxin VapB